MPFARLGWSVEPLPGSLNPSLFHQLSHKSKTIFCKAQDTGAKAPPGKRKKGLGFQEEQGNAKRPKQVPFWLFSHQNFPKFSLLIVRTW